MKINSSRRPLLSIVTVTYNDLKGLQATLDSLRGLFIESRGKIEVLVQDGQTTGIEDLIFRFGSWVVFESEPDGGIYDAMNRGLDRTKGEFVWFLNGGDLSTISNWAALESILRESHEAMIMGAYVLDFGSKSVARDSRPATYLWHALPTSHQAIIYPGDLARRVRYDVEYKIAGDYAFTARLSRLCKSIQITDLPLAAFGIGGSSHVHAKQIAAEASRVQRQILARNVFSIGVSRALHTFSRQRRKFLAAIVGTKST